MPCISDTVRSVGRRKSICEKRKIVPPCPTPSISYAVHRVGRHFLFVCIHTRCTLRGTGRAGALFFSLCIYVYVNITRCTQRGRCPTPSISYAVHNVGRIRSIYEKRPIPKILFSYIDFDCVCATQWLKNIKCLWKMTYTYSKNITSMHDALRIVTPYTVSGSYNLICEKRTCTKNSLFISGF